MMTLISRLRAAQVSSILLLGALGAGCTTAEEATMAEELSNTADVTGQDPETEAEEATMAEELSNTADVTGQDPETDVVRLEGDDAVDGSSATEAVETAEAAPTCVFLSIDRPGIVTKT